MIRWRQGTAERCIGRTSDRDSSKVLLNSSGQGLDYRDSKRLVHDIGRQTQRQTTTTTCMAMMTRLLSSPTKKRMRRSWVKILEGHKGNRQREIRSPAQKHVPAYFPVDSKAERAGLELTPRLVPNLIVDVVEVVDHRAVHRRLRLGRRREAAVMIHAMTMCFERPGSKASSRLLVDVRQEAPMTTRGPATGRSKVEHIVTDGVSNATSYGADVGTMRCCLDVVAVPAP